MTFGEGGGVISEVVFESGEGAGVNCPLFLFRYLIIRLCFSQWTERHIT